MKAAFLDRTVGRAVLALAAAAAASGCGDGECTTLVGDSTSSGELRFSAADGVVFQADVRMLDLDIGGTALTLRGSVRNEEFDETRPMGLRVPPGEISDDWRELGANEATYCVGSDTSCGPLTGRVRTTSFTQACREHSGGIATCTYDVDVELDVTGSFGGTTLVADVHLQENAREEPIACSDDEFLF